METQQNLVKDFDRIKRKSIRAFLETSKKDKKLQIGDAEAEFVMESVTGRELTVSIVEGTKTSYLWGFEEIATGLGFADGDAGRAGVFRFDYMPKEAFNKAKRAGNRISRDTIDRMMKGDAKKFAKRNVKNIIKDGIREGKPASDIASGIGSFFDDTKYWKAAEITRTEIPMAYNLGRIEAARTDGLKKAKIELGGRPCHWCIDNHEGVHTLDQAESYMNAHHPNNDCTVVPLISFEEYGIEPPPGYYPDEVGPIAPPTIPRKEIARKLKSIEKKIISTVADLPVVSPSKEVGVIAKETSTERTERVVTKKTKKMRKVPSEWTEEFNEWTEKHYGITLDKETYNSKAVAEFIRAIRSDIRALHPEIRKKLLDSKNRYTFKFISKEDRAKVNEFFARKYKERLSLNWNGLCSARDRTIWVVGEDVFDPATNKWVARPGKFFAKTSRHENAHRIYNEGGLFRREEFDKVWDKFKGQGVTSYANTDRYEFFAESFALQSALRYELPEVYEWLKLNYGIRGGI